MSVSDPTSAHRAEPDWSVIELRIEKIADLFDPFDPFPTPSRDLSHTAEEFIVGWARESALTTALRIVVHAPIAECGDAAIASLQNAVRNHFRARAQRVRGDLHELFRVGRQSLLIGLGVLALCIAASRVIEAMLGDAPLAPFLSEGLIILGWVANWRPLEIFLYDWWPLAQRRRLFDRLSAASLSAAPITTG
ncbi:MAG: hypothetical protein NW206_12340 [Hyphomonadaceae bacterium]|nr:hypothetical protein [Hyphomonadaceae bacterium]